MTSRPGKVVLAGLEFHARHGVYEEELRFGARFVVDLDLEWDFTHLSDHIDATVNYALVYESVRHEVTEKHFKLIEMLAERIAARILQEHSRLARVTVRVHKPHAPIPGIFRDVYAEVIREQVGTPGQDAAQESRAG
ncbi:dihydroneopterin aldolase [Deinococcus peraridilitoris]|nr:dihydroneopterin aldolase [Deinococcus peraridilitoris]